MENDGLEAMMYDLQRLQIPNDVNLRVPPRTEALTEQVIESFKGFDRWWYDVLTDGYFECYSKAVWEGVEENLSTVDETTVSSSDLYDSYTRGTPFRPISKQMWGRALKERSGAKRAQSRKEDGSRPRQHILPPLNAMRLEFTKQTGAQFDEHDERETIEFQGQEAWVKWGSGGDQLP